MLVAAPLIREGGGADKAWYSAGCSLFDVGFGAAPYVHVCYDPVRQNATRDKLGAAALLA